MLSGDLDVLDLLLAFGERQRALHNVTGSGVIDMFRGFAFTMTVAAHGDEDANAWGTVTGRSVDTSAFGIFGRHNWNSEADMAVGTARARRMNASPRP